MMSGYMRVSPLLLALVLIGCSAAPPAEPRLQPAPSPPTPVERAERAPTAMDVASPLPRWGVERIDAELRDRLVGRNWHPGCPVALGDLRLVTVRYLGFDGHTHAGPLVLNAQVADDVLWVFRRLFRHEFPIKRVALARKWHPVTRRDWFDTRSVTASFNCRPVTNGTSYSEHAYGWAVDINPLQNPYVNADGVLRKAARAFVDRTQDVAGMIHPGDVVVRSFARIGWGWGGDWQSLKDYQHFSLTGR